jgi:hypothetical protein
MASARSNSPAPIRRIIGMARPTATVMAGLEDLLIVSNYLSG